MVKKAVCALLSAAACALLICAAPLPARALTTNLRVGYCDQFAPYQYQGANGAAGIHVDMLNAIADEQSLSLEYIPYSRNSACYEALSNGEIDLVLGAPSSAAEQYNFRQSNQLTTFTMCLIATDQVAKQIKANGSVAGCLGIIEQGSYQRIFSQLRSQNRSIFNNNVFLIADNQREIIQQLLSGKVQLAVCEKESALYYLNNMTVSDGYTVVINYLFQASSVLLIRQEDAVLARTLNFGLAELRSNGTYAAILDEWLTSDTLTISRETWQTVLFLFACGIAALLLYVFASAHMRKLLRIQVEQRTSQLDQINQTLSASLSRLAQENKLRSSIIQNSSSAMIALDNSGRVTFLNQQATALCGLGSRAAAGRSAADLPLLGTLLQLSRPNPNTENRPELLTPGPDGRKIFRCSQYQLPDGQGILFSAEDVTTEEHEKQSAFEMEKSRVLNTLVAGIAHEIKNPITAIQTYAALIPTQMENEEFLTAFARSVPKETTRINTLIESLINYARPSRGETSVFDLSELVTSSVSLTASVAQKLGISIQLRLERPAMIRGCRDHISHAVINYLMNALEAIQEKQRKNGGRSSSDLVCVFLRKADGRVQAEIYDQGGGMDAQQLRQCMDPFFTTKAKGTGLGMAIARQRIRENGGEVTAESVPGSYTRIIIEFEECF